MIASKSFTIPAEGKLLAVMTSVLTLGPLSLVLLAVAAVVAAVCLIDYLLGVLVDLSTRIATLYTSSGPALKLFMLSIAGCLLVKLFPLVKRSLAASNVGTRCYYARNRYV